jgi:hypothetical protein
MAGSPCGHFFVHSPDWTQAFAFTFCLLYSPFAHASNP